MVRMLSLFFAVFMSYAAAAAVEIQSISGASAQVGIGSTASTTIEVFAGLAGTCSGGNPCDSCANVTDPPTACNEQRIEPDGSLVFNLKTAGATAAKVIKEDSTVEIGSSGTVSQAVVQWRDLCTEAGNIDCSVANGALTAKQTLIVRVWQDTDGGNDVDTDEAVNIRVNFVPAGQDVVGGVACTDGVCPFNTFPGDEKIHLDDMQLPGSLTNSSKVSAVRVLFSTQSFQRANPSQADGIQDLSVTDDEIESTIIDGLENGIIYHFRLAVLDEAKNAFGFHDNAFLNDGTADYNTCVVGANTASPLTCRHAGKPDQVLGLLSKDMNCFIATAAYDSSLEPKLNVFRKFRRVVLLQHEWGRSFNRWYYDVGPRGAMFIHDKPWAKSIVQLFLWPTYGFALMSLRWGLATAIATFTFIPLILISLLVLHRRRSARVQM